MMVVAMVPIAKRPRVGSSPRLRRPVEIRTELLLLVVAIAVQTSGKAPPAEAVRLHQQCAYAKADGLSGVGELLHNGVCIPSGEGAWPPPAWYRGPSTPLPPYLQDCPATSAGDRHVTGLNCRPSAITIDIGRQLFVDDFLVDTNRTNASREFHAASMADDDASGVNPVIRPSLPWEASGQYLPAWGSTRSVLPFPGGVWYVRDAAPARRFQMYYYVPSGPTGVAHSADGVQWNKLGTGPGGSSGPLGLNTIATPTKLSASSTIWYNANPPLNDSQRWSMGFQPVQLCNLYPTQRNPAFGDCSGTCDLPCATAILTSVDGLNWTVQVREGGAEGDASSFFYEPFRQKFVLSMKSGRYGRSRDYAEGDTLAQAAVASKDKKHPPVYWASADDKDHPCQPGGSGTHAEIYELMANAYESVTVMLISIFQGKGVNSNSSFAVDEHDNVALGFSRDGFHYSRTDPPLHARYREPFIREACPSWTAETAKSDPNCSNSSRWNFVNVQPTGGGFLVFENEIRFYVSGRRPNHGTNFVDGHSEIAVGIARLRRDGFASFSTPSFAVVTTHPVKFSGSFLWINAKVPATGSLAVEVLDYAGYVLEPWGKKNSTALVDVDKTKIEIRWNHGRNLAAAAGQAVRLRFELRGGAQLFSFWVSSQPCGASNGFVGAGGPDYPSQRDNSCA